MQKNDNGEYMERDDERDFLEDSDAPPLSNAFFFPCAEMFDSDILLRDGPPWLAISPP